MRSSLDYFNFSCYYSHSQNCILNRSNNATKTNRYSSRHQSEYRYGVGLLPVSVEKISKIPVGAQQCCALIYALDSIITAEERVSFAPKGLFRNQDYY